ncbi:hypothetical protein Pst134EB_016656 [Puccinia striiformis f. sp. tritici]|uniref:HAT C-terminal dimerisation domain-containing protein n=1 Tax=Puccinia striiformis f. sp. tritici PST-78 TaxID=1165861 RepID=A0A0L0VIE9_9BASI|nr:hypothetical protein Pst134EB_016656 [Puccinia striiformis f. sp. tritici]KNE99060.1 hypothetical protein PSTG_07711 [Puccinia striiformis f. sp. tritici PST-78]
MAPRTRKKTNPPTDGASTAPSSQPQTQDRGDEIEIDSDEEDTANLRPLTDSEALVEKARQIALRGTSSSYRHFKAPVLSDQKDKTGRLMIGYPCKLCPTQINRPMSDSSCSNLNKHVAICSLKKQEVMQANLATLGITGTGDIDPKEVPQLCVIWCAEAARPFSALVDPSHQALLHPTVRKHLPSRKAVSKDIHLLYSAIQDNYRSVLQAHQGALYLGVDGWQSPNGFDILGTVIYRLAEDDNGHMELEAMPLDFVRLSAAHTGEYLAENVRIVVEKFGIQNKICGLSILRPFGSPKPKKRANNDDPLDPEDGHGRHLVEEDDTPGQIEILARGDQARAATDYEDECSSEDEDGIEPSYEDADLSEADIDNASDEDENDRYTSTSCRETLAKFRAIAKKLRYSPNSKAEFIDICQERGCATPHTVERDVRTRWNSTGTQLKSILRCEAAILVWQRHKKFGLERKYYVDESDFDLARDLVDVLNLFFEITLQISVAGSARLADIVLFIDQITEHLSTAITNEKYPPALRNACRFGLKKTNKYYSLTDSSPLYRIAILLHPSLQDEYFKLANWEPEWIAEAIRLARDMWLTHYKPRVPKAATSTPSTSARPKTTTTMLAGLGSAAAARDGLGSSDPFDMWLCGGLVLNDGHPVNPLKWWMKQKRSGNTHGGLVHMALDVLSCPATSVDVERAFSFGRDYVTSKRHKLAPKSVSRGMTVAFYSKNKKIPDGILNRWKHGLTEDQKMQKKGKGKRKIITVDED